MPVDLILRVLTRVAVLAGVVFLRRRTRGAVPVPPSHRTPGTGAGGQPPVPEWVRALTSGRIIPDVVEHARLAALGLAMLVLGGAALVLVSGGTTLTVLGPRWLGIVMLAIAVVLAAGAVREGRWLARGVALRRRRRRVEEIAGPR